MGTMEILKELNERRARTWRKLSLLGMMNNSTKEEDRIAADIRYRLSYDAWEKADQEYRDAISRLSAEELEALSNG